MSVPVNEEVCETCCWFSSGGSVGKCHRYPQAVRVTVDHWCGEWGSLAQVRYKAQRRELGFGMEGEGDG